MPSLVLSRKGGRRVGAAMIAIFCLSLPSTVLGPSEAGGPFLDSGEARGIIKWIPVSLPPRPEQPAAAPDPLEALLPRGAPLAAFEITGEFGPRRHPLTRRQVHHGGIDLRAPLRSPVRVTAAGTVAFAGTLGAYGKMIEVDHGNGIVTRYGHLATILVKKDQVLKQGHLIARSGATGRVTGPHLHYEVLVDGTPHDPTELVEAAMEAIEDPPRQASGQKAVAQAISPQPSRAATGSIEETP